LKSQLQENRVPVSRTRKPSKKKNSLAPSSKEARQKIRRWSFVVEVTRGDTVKTFQPPALTIGNMTSARAAADTILNDIASLDQFKDCKVVVNPKAEETVSLTILNQINGLNEQSRLLTFALKRAVTDVVKQNTSCPCHQIEDEAARQVEFDRHVTELLGKYVMEEQQSTLALIPTRCSTTSFLPSKFRLSSKQRQPSKNLPPNRSTQILSPTGSLVKKQPDGLVRSDQAN
jgi:hypothetical protein